MKKAREILGRYAPFFGLAFIVAVFGIFSGGRFFAGSNLVIILNSCYSVIIVALGCTLMMSHGGVDLSVGAVMALAELTAAVLYTKTGVPWLMIPMAIVTAAACSCLTGLITVKLNMSPFISSLCMRFACRGVINTVMGSRKIGITGVAVPGWPVKLAVLLVLAAVVAVLIGYTKTGKFNRAIGESRVAAEASGINVFKHRMLAYLISGVFIGVAGYFDLLRYGTLQTSAGNGLEMNVIIAMVLGGVALSGGFKTGVKSAIIGSVLIVVFANGLTTLGVPSSWLGVAECLIFLAVLPLTYKKELSGLLPR